MPKTQQFIANSESHQIQLCQLLKPRINRGVKTTEQIVVKRIRNLSTNQKHYLRCQLTPIREEAVCYFDVAGI